MFRKILLMLVIGSFMVGTAFAGIKEVREAHANKDYTTCISEADKVLADESASTLDKAKAQRYFGYCYYKQRDYVKAIPAFQKEIADYPEERKLYAINQRYIGYCYYYQRDYVKAIPAFQKVIADENASIRDKASAQYFIGRCYKGMGKTAEAQESFLKMLTDYPEQTEHVKVAIDKVNFASMTNEEVQTLLNTILRATPATEKNAEFLGRIKSELEKFK